jgi:hypothetical protein
MARPSDAQTNYAPGVFTDVANIQAAGIPVIATETGDRNAPGTTAAPLVSNITAWADLYGMSPARMGVERVGIRGSRADQGCQWDTDRRVRQGVSRLDGQP